MNRVTVVMPVYNASRYIKEAVESILHQTYSDFLLLCIDDCSEDNSLEILQQIKDDRLRIVKNEVNRGIAYTRNVGLDMSETEYIALIDDDDIALPYRLEHEVQYLDAHQDIQVVGGHQRQIDGFGKDLDKQWSVYLNPDYIQAYLLLGNTVVNGSAMFRREFIRKHNIRFRDNMCGVEDYQFWVECSLKGKIKNLDEVLLLWRVAGQNTTYHMIENHTANRFDALARVKKYALEQTGFILEEEELSLLCRVFDEEGEPKNRREIEKLYMVLRKVAGQAETLGLENRKEIVTMCRKRFGEKVGKAFFLWE